MIKNKNSKSIANRCIDNILNSEEYSHPLYETLLEYCERTYKDHTNIPFHMPGHKRNVEYMDFVNPFMIDITEIDGFDNYHNPEGIIKESMELAAKVYGTRESIYLVNGSTVGLIAAIYGVTNKKDKVIVARNCHKAVYNALFHQELEAEYIYPQMHRATGAYCGIDPYNLEEVLKKNVDTKAVIITSPTYEGVVSDIRRISEIVHKYNAVLIVDEAHGAHLPYMDMFPKSAIYEGADIVIQSLHKILPSLTQTAILHICSDRINSSKVHRYLGIYQSSSPSYVMMASMDNCTRFMCRKETGKLIENYYNNLMSLRSRINELDGISLVENYGDTMYDYDMSKLVISADNLNGRQLYDILHDRYGIQLEMASEKYVIGMTSLCDNFEHYNILYNALSEIATMSKTEMSKAEKGKTEISKAEKSKAQISNLAVNGAKACKAEKAGNKMNNVATNRCDDIINVEEDVKEKKCISSDEQDIEKCDIIKNDRVDVNDIMSEYIQIKQAPSKKMTIYEALNSNCEVVKLTESRGMISYEYVYLYPPGSPIIVPGEVISDEIIKKIIQYIDMDLNLIGITEDEDIYIVKK